MPGKIVILLIRCYQLLISPAITPSCRFSPSCSEYAAEAVRKHGAIRGTYLAAKRLLKCHPFGRHGYDPVPDKHKR